jgi:hypothetical protein
LNINLNLHHLLKNNKKKFNNKLKENEKLRLRESMIC